MIDFLRPATEDIAEGAGGDDARHDDELGVYDGGDGGQDGRTDEDEGTASLRATRPSAEGQATEPTVRTPTQSCPHIPPLQIRPQTLISSHGLFPVLLSRPLCASALPDSLPVVRSSSDAQQQQLPLQACPLPKNNIRSARGRVAAADGVPISATCSIAQPRSPAVPFFRFIL